MGIATELDQGVDLYMNNFVTTTSSNLASALVPLALSAVTIYILMYGYAVMRGEAHDSVQTFVWKAIKISMISAVALGGGAYQSIVVDFVQGLQTGLSTTLSGSPSLPTAIDNMAVPYQELKAALFQSGFSTPIPSFGIVLGGLIVAIAHAWIMFVTLGFYLVAKVCLALVLAIGPLFVLCAMFPVVQQFAESWLRQAAQTVLLNVLIAATIAMITSLAKQFAKHIATNADTMMVIEATCTLAIVSLALGYVVTKHDQLAAQLAGGLSFGNLRMPRLPNRGGSSSSSSSGQNTIDDARGGVGNRAANLALNSAREVGHTALDTAQAMGQAGGALYNRYVLENIRRAAR